MHRPLALAAAFAVLSGPAAAQTPKVDEAWVERFEARVQLNDVLKTRGRETLTPINGLVRFYRLDQTPTGPVVRAVFTTPWPAMEAFPENSQGPNLTRPGVHIGEPFPVIYDGGCDVITLTITYDSGEVTQAYCNGFA